MVLGIKRIELTFEADLPEVTCHFVSPAGGIAFGYLLGSDEINIVAQALEANPAACEPGEIDGDFTIETTAGGAVILD